MSLVRPEDGAFNVNWSARLRGQLDVAALQAAVNELARRHDSLRTAFRVRGGEPIQMIQEPCNTEIHRVDLTGGGPVDRETDAQAAMRMLALEPFDLCRAPLFRTVLLRVADDDGIFLFSAHHIVCDGWSSAIIKRELGALYAAYSQAQASPLSPVPLQYAEYARRERDASHRRDIESQLTYWKKQLQGLAPLAMPVDRPRPAVPSFRAGRSSTDLGPTLREGLQTLGRRHGATLYMVLLAAFQLLLSRWCNQADVAVGSPIAGRTRRDTEDLVGAFVNTIVLRADLSDDPTFLELLKRVRRTTLDAFTRQNVPFEEVSAALEVEARGSWHPLLQVMFTVYARGRDTLRFPGVQTTMLDRIDGLVKFDLTVEIVDEHDKLSVNTEYATDIFDRRSIAALLDGFCTLLDRIAIEPERRSSDFDVTGPTEVSRLVHARNQTTADYAKTRRLEELFADIAAANPERPALMSGSHMVTYGVLDAWSDQFAACLEAYGVREGVVVGICIERSIEFVVAQLAILKARGAYLPLDPTYPADRLTHMLARAAVSLVVARPSTKNVIDVEDVEIIIIEESRVTAPVSRRHVSSSEELAYVMYTSGSTGAPKAIGVTHRNVVNFIAGISSLVSLEAGSSHSWWTTPCFDVGVYEVFSSLLSGGVLRIVPERERGNPSDFAAWLAQSAVESAYVPPFALQPLLEVAQARRVSLRRILVGVEPIPERLLFDLRRAVPGLDVINGYGPTETTVCATAYVVPDSPRSGPTPIGKPLPNVQVYVLDRHLRPVIDGSPGELYVGGDGVSAGYIGQPELTVERFVANPFAPGDRMYRTGDVVRYLSDGNLEFLGRTDHQVKVGGYRIELGEIESELLSHKGVSQAVVVVNIGQDGARRLVAYVAASPADSVDTRRLEAHLARRLPPFMVPRVIVSLKELPLTAVGKVDRTALSARPMPAPAVRASTPPRTHVEKVVLNAWRDVLSHDCPGVEDSFFELGGTSLAAAQAIANVNAALGVEIPLEVIFRAQTVEDMAQEVSRWYGGDAGPLVLPLKASENGRPLILIHALDGDLLPYFSLVRQFGPAISVYGVRAGLNDDEAAPWSVEGLAARYVAAISAEISLENVALAGWSFGGLVAYEMARQMSQLGTPPRFVGLVDTYPPRASGSFEIDDDALRSLYAKATECSDDQVDLVDIDSARVTKRNINIGRKNYQALSAYCPDLCPCPIYYFSAEYAAKIDVEKRIEYWKDRASAKFIHIHVSGNHYNMLKSSNVTELVKVIEKAIGEAAIGGENVQ